MTSITATAAATAADTAAATTAVTGATAAVTGATAAHTTIATATYVEPPLPRHNITHSFFFKSKIQHSKSSINVTVLRDSKHADVIGLFPLLQH